MNPAAFLIIQRGRPHDPLDAVLPHRARTLCGDHYDTVPLYTEEQAREIARTQDQQGQNT